jgi:hypothetical protein
MVGQPTAPFPCKGSQPRLAHSPKCVRDRSIGPPPAQGSRFAAEPAIRSNAVDKRWAEELIAGAGSLEQLENSAIGTADNRWRILRMNGKALVRDARDMASI